MKPVLEGVELLAPSGPEDDQLAVDDVAAAGELDLGEVAPQGLAVARLEEDVVAVDEGERPEAVELRLERPAVTLRQLLSRQGELGSYRRIQGEDGTCLPRPIDLTPSPCLG